MCVFCLLKVIIIPDVPGEKNGIWKECKKLNGIGPITESGLLNCDIIGNSDSLETVIVIGIVIVVCLLECLVMQHLKMIHSAERLMARACDSSTACAGLSRRR